MARLAIRDLRRNELIDATLAAIAEGGMSEITLATIAAQAGVSPALVNHYFEGKDDLLEAAMRRLAADLGEAFLKHLPPDPKPIDRLHAVIDSCLLADNFRPGSMVIWLSTPSASGPMSSYDCGRATPPVTTILNCGRTASSWAIRSQVTVPPAAGSGASCGSTPVPAAGGSR